MNTAELRQYARKYEYPVLQKTMADLKHVKSLPLSDEDKREQRRKLICDLYGREAQKMKEDQEAVDVQGFTEKYNAAVISCIKSYGHIGPFRPINRKQMKFIRLFDILLRPGLMTSGSTIQKGDPIERLYGSWGVIIGRGTINEAFPYDAVTMVHGGKVKSRFQPRQAHIRPAEKLKFALEGRDNHYNELNVRTDAISGVFFSEHSTFDPADERPQETFLNSLSGLRLPYYMVKQGEFYPIADITNLDSVAKDPVEPNEIINTVVEVNDYERQAMIHFLSANLQLPVRNCITSGVNRGRFVYGDRSSGGGSVQELDVDIFLHEMSQFLTESQLPSSQVYAGMAMHTFADLALQNNDLYSAQKVLSAVEGMKLLNYDTYSNFSQRIRPGSGALQVTVDDINHYLQTGGLPDYLAD